MLQEQSALSVGDAVQDDYGNYYCVEQQLGQGGFGAVYLVSEGGYKQKVFALKEVINPSKQDRRRLRFECEVLKRLNHPALPRVYSVFEQERHRRLYLLMEYIEGKELEVLRMEQPAERFPLALALTLLDPIVDALTYLHQQEPPILHRDIKPANIIVPLDGSIAALVDFGTAKEYLPESTTTMFRHGTPGYAAIEQYSHESATGIRTDVYGLGATLYTLLTGVKPVDALKRIMSEKRRDPFQPVHDLVPDIPRQVSQAISHALALHYEDRFDTVEDFWHALHTDSVEQEAETQLLDTSKLEKQEHTRASGRKRMAVFSLVLLTLIALVAGGLGLLFSSKHSAAPPVPVIRHASPQKTVLPATSPGVGNFPYPPIAPSYTGTISDISVAHKTTKLYLVQVSQKRNSIAGYFQGLGQVGSFTGTVNSSGGVHFIVKYGNGSLIFDGEIKVGGDIAGTFYAMDQQGQNIDEYGPWYASSS